ncbi:MAG: hypothetical protein JST68_30195 [Bacteroidetes bacterium]|nr:hypothetical protein [Bacteroidota bacterium]
MEKIKLIFNPAAGSKDPVTVEEIREKGFEGEIVVTGKEGDVYSMAKEMVGAVDVLAVYGGDGTVMEAARALYKTDTALGIVPGGTANVMAKELNIPLELGGALELLGEEGGGRRVRKVDMGLVNGRPFLIRVNMGLFSDMITETDPALKEKWGQLAYGLTAFQTMGREPGTFQLTVDGRTFDQDAVALTVTNAGNVGRAGYSFLSDISVDDGWLDVIALDKADIGSLLRVSGSILLQKDSDVLKHWRARKVEIRLPEGSSWLCDDMEEKGDELSIEVAPAALGVVVPI